MAPGGAAVALAAEKILQGALQPIVGTLPPRKRQQLARDVLQALHSALAADAPPLQRNIKDMYPLSRGEAPQTPSSSFISSFLAVFVFRDWMQSHLSQLHWIVLGLEA